jgi:hypothetical protein
VLFAYVLNTTIGEQAMTEKALSYAFPVESYVCKICGKTFPSKWSLWTHSIAKHRRKIGNYGFERGNVEWLRGKWWEKEVKLELSDVERAYIAGIIDGEGCISPQFRHGRVHVKVEVRNTNLNLIKWLLSKTGLGHVYTAKNRANWKQTYSWEVFRFAEVRAILKVVQPFLIVKRKQAELTLKILEIREQQWKKALESIPRDSKGRFVAGVNVLPTPEEVALANEVKILNKKGV